MTDDEFRDLIERASAIRELTRTDGWQYLADRAAHTVGAQQRSVLSGSVTSLEQYNRLVGWCEGATFVLGLADRVTNEVEAERRARSERESA